MDNPLDMTKETLERLEAEAAGPEYHHRQEVHKGFGGRSEKEKTESDPSRVAFVVAAQEERRVPERRLSMENENRCEKDKIEDEQSRTAVLGTVQDEERAPKRRLSVEYEMMPPPPSPATCHLPPPASPATCHLPPPPSPATCHLPPPPSPATCHLPPPASPATCHLPPPPSPATCHLPPPASPAMRPRSATPRREFSQPRSPAVNSPYWASAASPGLAALGLEGPGAVPEHLFSPARQEHFGARGSPKYQDLGLDFQQPQSVGSVDLDMFNPATPGQPMYGPSTPSGQSISYPNTQDPSTPGGQREEPDGASTMSFKQQQQKEVTKSSPDDENRSGSMEEESANKDEHIRREGAENQENSVSEVEEIAPEENSRASASEETASVATSQNTATNSVVESTPVMHVVKAQMPRRKQAAAPSRGAWRFSATISEEPFTPKVQIRLPKDSPLHSLILPPPAKKIETAISLKLKPKEKEKVPVKRNEKAKSAKKKPVIKKVKYKCGACGKKCVTLEMVKTHLCLPRLQCLDCLPSEVVLPSRPLLLHHLETDHPNLILLCKQCDQEFHSETLLKWHTKVHEVERQKNEEVAVTQAVADALEAAIASEKSKSQKIVSQKEVMDTESQMPGEAADSVEVTPHEVVDEFHQTNELEDLPLESIVELEVPVTTIPESSNPEELETIMELETSRRDEEFEDAPSTPVAVSTSLQKSTPKTRPLPEPSRSPTFECSKCKKTFNTRLRFNNHRLRCGIEVKKEPIPQRPIKKKNARFEEMKVNWREALMTRERCGKCGRTNYTEDTLEKHKRVCKGNLLRVQALLPCPFCVKPARSFNSDVSLQVYLLQKPPFKTNFCRVIL